MEESAEAHGSVSGPYTSMLCVFEGSRLDTPWHCPMKRCYFTTDVRRTRASHLLRSHHRLFEGNRHAPRLLVGQELAERLEAFRLRDRGSRQRARENQRAVRAAASVGGGLAETPMADPPASPDEVFGDAAIDRHVAGRISHRHSQLARLNFARCSDICLDRLDD